MADDLNKGSVIGRLTRDAELIYTAGGVAYAKFSIAVNRSKKVGEQWTDEAHFFDFTLWGKRAESLNPYLLKGQQVGIEYSLKQERWEQDGNKRQKVSFDLKQIQLVGSKKENTGPPDSTGQPSSYTPPANPAKDDYEDDIPF